MLPWLFDFTNVMVLGDTLTSASAKLYNVSTGTSTTPVSAPVISGNTVQVKIVGPNVTPVQAQTDPLVAGDQFRLEVTVQSNTSTVWAMALTISVPF